MPDSRAAELHRRLVWVTVFRAGVVAALLLATAVYAFSKQEVGLGDVLKYLFVITGVTFGQTLAYALIIRNGNPRHFLGLAYAQVVGDITLAGALLWLTGGSDSPFAFLFTYGVFNAAILLYRRGAMFAAALATLGYAFVTLSMRWGWVAPAADYLTPDNVRLARLIFSMGVNSGAFFLVAVLGAYLGEQVRQAGVRVVEAEADLAALSELHQRIVHSISSGILTLGPDQRITYLNRAGAEILEIAPAAASGKRLSELTPALEVALRDVRVGGIRSEVELEGGKVLGFAITPMGESGEEVVVFQDLTSLRVMERKVRRSERLAALGSLAAGLAHELRNPLASMSGSIELLQAEAPAEGEEATLMAIVLREIERLETLVADFLSFARPRPPDLRAVEITPLLEEVLLLMRHDPRVEEGKLELQAEAGLGVMADPEQLRQVVANLVLNAVQAKVGGAVVVRALAKEDQIVLEVVDEGPGMDAETLDHIFEPFFTTKQGGTGLGLALVHSIVEAHGGEIGVESSPGKGTIVRMILPGARREG
ncbi:MAG: ATP-binding protein [Deltaproteobacteria bacterium]|nr:ATP-binding protein [Deltaproteobacteria bacterium]